MDKIDPKNVRRSVIAGSWYPGTEGQLRKTVQGYLDNVEKEELEGELIGLISPHAGYIYSGQVAAYAYKQLDGASLRQPFDRAQDTAYDAVAVISPVHRMFVDRFAATSAAAYETPLGLVEVDAELVEAIDKEIGLARVPQDNEHSLEIQLPFLQVVLGEFKLLPIMMGDQELSSCQKLGTALAKVLKGKNVLLVASTDLSHFHNYDAAVRLDEVVLERVRAYDPEGLVKDLERRKCEACGGGPVIAVMLAAQELGANKAKVLKYMNSGDVTGDHSQVVGYMAAALYRART
jgi:AmmeMemoRadiSam system protein B